MNYEELKKYIDDMHKSIINKLKDNEEELDFYAELVKKFNSVCKDYYKLKQALDEIEKYLDENDYEYIYQDCKLIETRVYDDLKEIINKAKGK